MTSPSPTSSPKRLADLPGPKGLPIVGNVPIGRTDRAHLVFESWAERYGNPFQARFGGQRAIGVSDAATIRRLLQERPDTFRRVRTLETISREDGLLGVFSAEGADWRRQRRLLNPSFHASHLDTFFDAISTMTERLGEVVGASAERGESVDVLRTIMRYTVDVTSVVAFGRDLDTQRNGSHEVQGLAETIMSTILRRSIAPVRTWRWLRLPRDRAYDRAHVQLRAFLHGIITAARTSTGGTQTLLETMIAARDDEDAREPLSDEEVYANVVTLLLAGEDTTAITITWMLHYLATRPDVLARARAEVDSVLGDARVPTRTMVRSLAYLEALALETLRLRGPVPVMFLEAAKDTTVGDVEVPAGTLVLSFLRLAMTKDPELFGSPDELRPERWLADPPTELLPHSPRLMLAFGAGPRVCPGRGLALLESALAVATILRSFELEVADPAAPITEVSSFTVMPSVVRLRFRSREVVGRTNTSHAERDVA